MIGEFRSSRGPSAGAAVDAEARDSSAAHGQEGRVPQMARRGESPEALGLVGHRPPEPSDEALLERADQRMRRSSQQRSRPPSLAADSRAAARATPAALPRRLGDAIRRSPVIEPGRQSPRQPPRASSSLRPPTLLARAQSGEGLVVTGSAQRIPGRRLCHQPRATNARVGRNLIEDTGHQSKMHHERLLPATFSNSRA